MLAPLLFNISFAAVINKRDFHAFQGGQDIIIMDAFNVVHLVHLRKKPGAGGAGGATSGRSVLETSLWRMLDAFDAGVVPQTPEQLRKMMGVIAVLCAAFGLAVSEAKTETMCLRTKGMPEATTILFSLETDDQVYSQTNEFVYISGGMSPLMQCRPVHREVDRRIPNAWFSSRNNTLELTARPIERSPRAQNPDAKSRDTQDNNDAVRLHHMEPARVPLRHVAPSPPQLPDSLHRLAKEQSHRSPDFLYECMYVCTSMFVWSSHIAEYGSTG